MGYEESRIGQDVAPLPLRHHHKVLLPRRGPSDISLRQAALQSLGVRGLGMYLLMQHAHVRMLDHVKICEPRRSRHRLACRPWVPRP